MQGYNVRVAERSDLADIASFNIAMAMETESVQLEKDVITNGVKAVFDDPKKGFYLVADNGNEVIGCLLITFEWSDWRNGYFWWIQSVFVKKEHRRKGVYKNMYSFIKDLAKNETSRIAGIRLYVEKDNSTAQNTYTKLQMYKTQYLLFESIDLR